MRVRASNPPRLAIAIAISFSFFIAGKVHAQNDVLIYSEDFNDGASAGWWGLEGWSIESSGSGLALRGGGQGHVHAGFNGQAWSDALLRLEFRLDGDSAHISYRDGDAGRYYIQINDNAVVLNKQINPDMFLDSLAQGPGISYGEWHVFEVDGQGHSLTVRVDGETLLTYEDGSPLEAGAFSFEAFDAVFWIDNIHVYVSSSQAPPQPPEGLTWIRTGGPIGGLGYDIRIHPHNDTRMYVTDNFAGVFRSENGGQTWSPINDGIITRTGLSGDSIPIFSLSIDPNAPEILWAGTDGARGIYKSTNGGDTWIQKDNGIEETSGITFRGFSVEPGNSEVVYTACEISSFVWAGEPRDGREFDLARGAVYKTIDGGENWTAVWRGDSLARYIWIDPNDVNVLYVSTGIFDREAANSDPDAAVKSAAAAGGAGIIKSVDGGETWTSVNAGLGNLYVGTLYMHPEDSTILLAGTGNNQYVQGAGVYLSLDGGANWQRTLSGDIINAVEFNDSDPGIAYAGSATAIYRSEDGGFSWSVVDGGADGWGSPGVRAGFPIDFQIDYEDPDRIFVNNYGGGNFLSEDGGKTWVVASDGYTGAQVRDVAVDPEEPARVYAAARSGIFITHNGGNEWQGRNYAPADVLEWYVVAVDPGDPGHVLASNNWMVSLLESHDYGRHWSEVSESAPQGQGWRAIAFAPSGSDIVYAGRSAFLSAGTFDNDRAAGGVYKSLDGGSTWQEMNDADSENANITALAVHPADPEVVYAAAGNLGVLKSLDGGANWTEENPGLPPEQGALSIALRPDDPEVILAGFENGGIYRSDDGGTSWEQSLIGMSPEATVSDIVIDPLNPEVVYATDRLTGVYVSTDGGERWAEISDGLRTRDVNSLAISSDGEHLYAASEGGGVFRLDLGSSPPPDAESLPQDDPPGFDEEPPGDEDSTVSENDNSAPQDPQDNESDEQADDQVGGMDNTGGGCGAMGPALVILFGWYGLFVVLRRRG